MKKLLIILLSALSLTAFAQQKKVAVYVTGEQSGISKVLGDQLVAAFAQSGKYIAVERTASFLAEMGKEQNYQRTGAVSDSEIARLGSQFGVNYVCVVDLSDVFGKKYISARLINVETAEIMSTANENSSLNTMEELMRVSNVLKGQLFHDSSDASLIPKGYVDLGLPSGIYWEKNSKSGVYLYDQAYALCAEANAKIPTVQQWNELLNECTWIWKQNGYEVKGGNGNTIFLRVNNYGSSASGYWTSTERARGAMYYFFFNNAEQKISSGAGFRDVSKEGFITIKMP